MIEQDMITTSWWWIRHAPVVNPRGRIYGQLDFEADLSDQEGFDTLVRVLPEEAVWVTTPLRRARDTADRLKSLMSDKTDTPEAHSLLEQNFGDWEGASWDEIPKEVGDAYWKDPARNPVPNGESFTDLVKRVSDTIEQMNNIHTGKQIVAVAHAGSIRAAISHALGNDAGAGLAFQLAPLSLSRIDAIHQGENTWWRVLGVNQYGGCR